MGYVEGGGEGVQVCGVEGGGGGGAVDVGGAGALGGVGGGVGADGAEVVDGGEGVEWGGGERGHVGMAVVVCVRGSECCNGIP